MATLTASKQEFEVLPVGEYLAQITDYEETTGNFGPQFKFRFEIVKPKAHAGKALSAWCSQKLTSGSKKSKLWGWVESAFNRPIEVGEQVDLDDLVGRQVVLVVITDTKDDGSEYNTISSIKAYKSQEPMPKPSLGGNGAAKSAKSDDDFEVGEPAKSDSEDPFFDE
jgi:hypothetical protein